MNAFEQHCALLVAIHARRRCFEQTYSGSSAAIDGRVYMAGLNPSDSAQLYAKGLRMP